MQDLDTDLPQKNANNENNNNNTNKNTNNTNKHGRRKWNSYLTARSLSTPFRREIKPKMVAKSAEELKKNIKTYDKKNFNIKKLKPIDFWLAIKYVIHTNWRRVIYSYIVVPIGIICVMCALYGVNYGLKSAGTNFPASVLLMLILFIFLLCINYLFGKNHKFKPIISNLIKILGIPLDFSVRWMGFFFTPGFVTLPNSGGIYIIQAIVIGAIYIVGYLVLFVFLTYLTWCLEILDNFIFKTNQKKKYSKKKDVEKPINDNLHDQDRENDITISKDKEKNHESIVNAENNTIITPIDHHLPNSPGVNNPSRKTNSPNTTNSFKTTSLPSTADPLDPPSSSGSISSNSSTSTSSSSSGSGMSRLMPFETYRSVNTGGILTGTIHPGMRVSPEDMKYHTILENNDETNNDDNTNNNNNRDNNKIISSNENENNNSTPKENNLTLQQWQIIAAEMINHLDEIIWFFFFIIGIPIYAGTKKVLFIQAPVTVLAWFAALKIPDGTIWKQVCHPILVCTAITLFAYFVIAVASHGGDYHSFLPFVQEYRTHRSYLQVAGPTEPASLYGVWPGPGDIIASLMDVSIVGLALPVYNYRMALRGQVIIVAFSNACAAFLSFFAYPPLGHALSLSPDRALALPGRSASLALAIPLVQSLDGNITTVSIMAVLSGIMGVVFGDYLFKLLRVPPDDYVIRGVVQGVNSSAVASSHLLRIFPRAGAIASLSFVLYGTLMIILAAVPQLVQLMHRLVEYKG